MRRASKLSIGVRVAVTIMSRSGGAGCNSRKRGSDTEVEAIERFDFFVVYIGVPNNSRIKHICQSKRKMW